MSVYVCKTGAQVLIRDQRQGLVSVGEIAREHLLMEKTF